MHKLQEWLEPYGVDLDALIGVLIPILILVAGWVLAVLLGSLTRRLLNRTTVDERVAGAILGRDRADKVDTSRWGGKAVYFIVLLFTVIAFLERLGLRTASGPIEGFLETVFTFAPRVIAAALIVLGAWIVATLLRKIVRTALAKTSLDEKIEEEAPEGAKSVKVSDTVAETVYWLIFLLFLPAVLGTLGLSGLLGPVQGMLDEVMAFLPNLASAVVIFVAGWFGARILQRIITNLLAAVGVDKLSDKLGINSALGKKKLSEVIGMVVHVLILIPIAIAGLHALELEAITRPASAMLTTMLAALPALFGAALVLGIAYVIGIMVSRLVSNILSSAGFDGILVKLGVSKKEPAEGERTPSSVIGDLVMAAIMIFASIEAANMLSFQTLAVLASDFLTLAGQIALGLAIFGLGLYLAALAKKAIHGSGVAHANLLATVSRIAILALAAAMGLRQMGIANEIITLGFGLVLGAVAVAAALAFGLGARDEAAKQVREWRAQLASEGGRPAAPRDPGGGVAPPRG